MGNFGNFAEHYANRNELFCDEFVWGMRYVDSHQKRKFLHPLESCIKCNAFFHYEQYLKPGKAFSCGYSHLVPYTIYMIELHCTKCHFKETVVLRG